VENAKSAEGQLESIAIPEVLVLHGQQPTRCSARSVAGSGDVSLRPMCATRWHVLSFAAARPTRRRRVQASESRL